MADELWAGRYRRDRLIGRGAMGEVWMAYDVVLDRQVAIKSISATRTDPDDQQRMGREARVAARIAHPNAVAVHDLLMVDDRPSLVMEFVEGDTLADRIKRERRLDPAQVAAIGAAVADALAEAHRLGIVHRDIKPANILITPRGVPKLADFGIARVAGEANMTATGMMVGTPAYMAPEIVHGGPADERSDVWSLGVTLYAALEGAPPFVLAAHDEPMAVLGRVLHAPIHPPSCGGAVARCVFAMLDRDPARRPSAQAVAALLRDPRSAPAAQDTTRLPGPGVGPTEPPAPDRSEPSAWSSQTRTDLRPGSEPVLPGGWSSGARPSERSGRRTGRVVAVAAAVVILLTAGTGGYLAFRAHENRAPAAAGPTGSSATGSSPTGSSLAGSGASTLSTRSSGSSTSTPSNDPATHVSGGSSYPGPGGVSVTGPTGWSRDDSGGNDNVVDYDAPGSNGFVNGLAFQIGIGNPHALPTIEAEAKGAKRYLRSVETGLAFPQTTYGTFLHAPSVTLEYTGINSHGVARHGIERLWVADGVTREVIVSGRAEQWSKASTVFAGLVSTCRVG